MLRKAWRHMKRIASKQWIRQVYSKKVRVIGMVFVRDAVVAYQLECTVWGLGFGVWDSRFEHSES